eukprot:s1809_g6.t1
MRDDCDELAPGTKLSGYWQPDEEWYACKLIKHIGQRLKVQWDDGTVSVLAEKEVRKGKRQRFERRGVEKRARISGGDALCRSLMPKPRFELPSHRYVLAPMVGGSELPFRMMTRQFGAQLCYTPMIYSGPFSTDADYRAAPENGFQTCPEDRPLVAHFCGNDPEVLLAAARHVADRVDAIDLNLGCPQRVAHAEHFGAYLLEKQDRGLVCSIVKRLSEALPLPVFCKIRLLDELEGRDHMIDVMLGEDFLVSVDCAASFSSKLFAIKDAERPCSSKNLAAQDVEQPSSSKTLVSKDVDQPATEDVENPLAAAADSNPDECTSSASSSSSSNSALPVVDTSGWGSEWHDVWQNAIALDRQCSGSKKRPQALKNLLKGIYVAKRRVDDPCKKFKEFFHLVKNVSSSDYHTIVDIINSDPNRPRDALGDQCRLQLMIWPNQDNDTYTVLQFCHSKVKVVNYAIRDNPDLVKTAFLNILFHIPGEKWMTRILGQKNITEVKADSDGDMKWDPLPEGLKASIEHINNHAALAANAKNEQFLWSLLNIRDKGSPIYGWPHHDQACYA